MTHELATKILNAIEGGDIEADADRGEIVLLIRCKEFGRVTPQAQAIRDGSLVRFGFVSVQCENDRDAETIRDTLEFIADTAQPHLV